MRRDIRRPGLVLLAAAAVIGASGCPRTVPRTSRAGGEAIRPAEDTLATVRGTLGGTPDPTTCSTALQQLNSYLGQHPDQRWAPLTAEQKAALARFTTDPGEVAEADSPLFTLLDAQHLEGSLLLRDAVQALEVGGLSPAEQAAAAFAWVVRQVRLTDPAGPGPAPGPPEYVLRRGWGTAQERALIVLEALRQLGLTGVLLTAPGRDEPWACGAVVPVGGQKDVVLFDHRLGVPVPGEKGPAAGDLARAFRQGLPVAGPEDGTQLATLALLRSKPDVLAALSGPGGKPTYDLTAEQVKAAGVQLAVPLSALAPRMRALEKEYLGSAVPVRLAIDPAAAVKDVAAAAGVAGEVVARPGAAGVLRGFLPDGEGGVDARRRKEQYHLMLLPLNLLPARLQTLEGEPRAVLWARFLEPFATFLTAPGQPRDHLLRGRTKEVTEALSPAIERTRAIKGVIDRSPELADRFEAWRKEVYQAYGDLARAQEAASRGGDRTAVEAARGQIDAVMKKYQPALVAVVEGAAAEPRLLQSLATLAQAMQEQAGRQQARADALARAGASPEDVAAAREAATAAWRDAAGWWESLTQEFPVSSYTPTARVGLARAADALGQRERARGLLLENLAQLNEHERLARQYLAARLAP